MADTIKELKSSVSKPSEENERPPQEEFVAAGKGFEQKGLSFVTHEDVIAMLEKKLSQSQEDWKYAPQPPKGSPKEHVNRFIDALGQHAGDQNLCLREFSKSLTDRAYTWYTTLAPDSVCSWEDLASRFRDLALDCYDEMDEEALVEICINNIVANYRAYLENIGINQFSWLLEAEAYPPLPCEDEVFHAVLDTMFANGAIKPSRPYKVPTREEK
ncbi:unnamed protein product [Prunus brigantina]